MMSFKARINCPNIPYEASTKSFVYSPFEERDTCWDGIATTFEGKTVTKYTVSSFIEDTTLFPKYIAVRANGLPYWCPFNPPKNADNFVEY